MWIVNTIISDVKSKIQYVMLSCWIGHGEQIHIREEWEIICERFIEHQLCAWLGDGKEGLVLVIRDRVQIKTKQTRSFQIGANALAEENQKDGVKSIWILDVIWQKKQMLMLLISFFPEDVYLKKHRENLRGRRFYCLLCMFLFLHF